jgi:hypothetical protein
MSLTHNPARPDEFKHDARWYLMPVAAMVVAVLLVVHGLVTVPDSPGDFGATTEHVGLAEAVVAP